MGVEKITLLEPSLTEIADYTRAWNSEQFLDYQYFCLMRWEIRGPVEPS